MDKILRQMQKDEDAPRGLVARALRRIDDHTYDLTGGRLLPVHFPKDLQERRRS